MLAWSGRASGKLPTAPHTHTHKLLTLVPQVAWTQRPVVAWLGLGGACGWRESQTDRWRAGAEKAAEWPGPHHHPQACTGKSCCRSGWHIYPRPPFGRAQHPRPAKRTKKNRNGERGTPTRLSFFGGRRQPLLLCACVVEGQEVMVIMMVLGQAARTSEQTSHTKQAKPTGWRKKNAAAAFQRTRHPFWMARGPSTSSARLFSSCNLQQPRPSLRSNVLCKSLPSLPLAFLYIDSSSHPRVYPQGFLPPYTHAFARKEGRHAGGLLRRVGLYGANARLLSALCTFFFVLVRRRPSSRYAHTA